MIVLICLGIHWPIFLVDGVFWDDYLVWFAQEKGDWNRMLRHMVATGNPLNYFYYRPFGLLPQETLVFRTVSFLLICAVAVLQYLVLRPRVGSHVALLATLLATAYTANRATVSVVVSIYMCFLAFFLAAMLCADYSTKHQGKLAVGARVASLAMFFFSFSYNALLVVHHLFLLDRFISYFRRKAASPAKAIPGFLRANLDYVALPWLFWFIKNTFWKKETRFSNYNQIELFDNPVLLNAAKHLYNGVFAQLRDALSIFFEHPWLLFLVLPATLAFLLVESAATTARPDEKVNPGQAGKWLVRGGFAGLALAIFPFAVVGAIPLVLGVQSRHALLVAIPVCMVIAGAHLLACSAQYRALRAFSKAVIGVVVAGFCAVHINQYADWELRAIKERAIVSILRDMRPLDNTAVYVIHDNTSLYPDPPRWMDWQGIFDSAWGGTDRVGILRQDLEGQFGSVRQFLSTDAPVLGFYFFNPLPHVGASAGNLFVEYRPGSLFLGTNKWLTVLSYYRARLGSKEELSKFLAELLSVKVAPESGP